MKQDFYFQKQEATGLKKPTKLHWTKLLTYIFPCSQVYVIQNRLKNLQTRKFSSLLGQLNYARSLVQFNHKKCQDSC